MHVVHIRKYGDLIPVQLRESDQEAHLEALAQTHGEAAIVLEDGRTLAEVRQPERDRAEQEAAEAAEAERVRLEAKEVAKIQPQSGDVVDPAPSGDQGIGETTPESGEPKSEVTIKRAAKKAAKKGGA